MYANVIKILQNHVKNPLCLESFAKKKILIFPSFEAKLQKKYGILWMKKKLLLL